MTNELALQGSNYRRWLGSCVIALVLLLIGLAPANALAAGEAAGGSGWTPQAEGGTAPESGGEPIQQGSSLGSGAGSQPTGSTTEAAATGTGSTDYVEPSSPSYTESGSNEYSEAPSAPAAEAESAPPAAVATPVEKPAASKPVAAKAGVGVGVPIARLAPPAASAAADPAAAAAPIASPSEGFAAGGSGVPMWLPVLGAVLVLLWVGRAIIGAYRRRRSQRPTPEPDWSPEAGEWEAVLEQIQQERSVGGKVRPLRAVEAEPDYGVAVVDENGRVAR